MLKLPDAIPDSSSPQTISILGRKREKCANVFIHFFNDFQRNCLPFVLSVKDVSIASINCVKVHIGADLGDIQRPWYDTCFRDQFEHQSPCLSVRIWNAGSRQAIISEYLVEVSNNVKRAE